MNETLSLALQDMIQTILLLIITTALPVLVMRAYQWLERQAAITKTQLDDQTLWLIQSTVSIFVKAAERSGVIGELSKLGADKKRWVISQVEEFMKQRGYTGIDTNLIAASIEAAIQDGIHKAQQPVVVQNGTARVVKPPEPVQLE